MSRVILPAQAFMFLFFIASSLAATDSTELDHEMAIRGIEKLGGHVRAHYDKSRGVRITVYLSRQKLVDDKNLAVLKRIRGLREVYLNNTDVTDKGLVHLSGLCDLEGVHLNQ